MNSEIISIYHDRYLPDCYTPKKVIQSEEYSDFKFADLLPILNDFRTERQSSVELQFNSLSQKWKKETKGISLTIKMVENENYKKLLELGVKIIPLVLKDLENSVIWFPLLKELTKANPVPKEYAGDSEKMREAWIEWGESLGLI